MKKVAGIELAKNGMGVSTTARLYVRKNNVGWEKAQNDRVNDLIAIMFDGGAPRHRYKLSNGDIAEVRESGGIFLIGAMRRGTYDIIVIQPTYKESRPEISKRRLEDEDWKGLR